MSKLAELGIKADFDHFDAGRDVTKLAGYLRANRKELSRKDLIYTFGTTATVTVQNFDIGNVPHVFNIVPDPIGAGITLSIDAPTNGATGAKMSLSTEVILQLLETVLPYKSLAVLFDPRDINSTIEANNVTVAAQAIDKTTRQLRLVPDLADLETQIQYLRPQISTVDAIYIAASSSFVAQTDLLHRLLPEETVSISSSPAIVDRGTTLAFGDEYWNRGEAAAEAAAQILLNGKLPSQVAINEIPAHKAILFVRRASPAKHKLDLKNAANPVKYR